MTILSISMVLLTSLVTGTIATSCTARGVLPRRLHQIIPVACTSIGCSNHYGISNVRASRAGKFSNSKTSLEMASIDSDSASLLPKDNVTDLTLNFAQLKPFLKIAVPFFKEDKVGRESLAGVVALVFLNSGISVAFSYISRDFYTALNNRDETMFYQKIELFFVALLFAVPVSVYYRFIKEKLSIYWREALTAKVLDKYYSNRTFYIIETLREVDNPDQRITEDIRHFTRTSLDLFVTIIATIIDLFSFSAILFQIYPGLFAAIIAYAGVGSLVTTKLGAELVKLNYGKLVAEADFRFSLFRTRENAESITFYDSDAKLEKENTMKLFADALETSLDIVKVQRNLEVFTTAYRYIVQILPSLIVAPLYFARKVELGAVSQSYGAFNHILNDFSLIINQFETVSAFSAGLTRLGTFIDTVDQDGWGDVPVNVSYPMLASNVKSLEAQAMPEVAVGPKVVNKPLIAMTAGSRVAHSYSPIAAPPAHRDAYGESAILSCRNLTLFTPDGSRTIIGGKVIDAHTEDLQKEEHIQQELQGVDVSVSQGERVLIVGGSGTGKSSFVRAIAGLWQVGHGTVQWNVAEERGQEGMGKTNEDSKVVYSAPKEVFFLPQKPYNVLGTLKEQIMYPNIIGLTPGNSSSTALMAKEEEDSFFLDILDRVRLSTLSSKMGGGDPNRGLRTITDWSKVLSLGEQQRLAFARVLYNKPSVVVLDEGTSALDLASEEAMYGLLTSASTVDREGRPLTVISVGHRPSLIRYHSSKLIFRGPGENPVRVLLPDAPLRSNAGADNDDGGGWEGTAALVALDDLAAVSS